MHHPGDTGSGVAIIPWMLAWESGGSRDSYFEFEVSKTEPPTVLEKRPRTDKKWRGAFILTLAAIGRLAEC